jgi:hypothetical protein
MKIKTQELTGPALDWAVARCENYLPSMLNTKTGIVYGLVGELNFSTNWAQGGPIIERAGIRQHRSHTGDWWAGSESDPQRPISGPTPLIAAMRCYVTSRLGDEVDIPEELTP